MSFSFGFFEPGQNGVEEHPPAAQAGQVPKLPLRLHPQLNMFEQGGDIVYTPLTYDHFLFKKVDIAEDDSAIDKISDIVPGVYEGGNKIWECSVDLAKLLTSNGFPLPTPSTSSAIELGCGHGLPGIAALQLGYKAVVFSDLNADVIDAVTWPNIYLNCADQVSHARCYSGDWEVLSEHLLSSNDHQGGGKFELILSAETLYSKDCCTTVYGMVKRHLAPDGVALLASKRFYFGVGGGTYSLQTLVEKEGCLSFEVLQVFEDGQSNIREIVCLRHR